MTRIEDNLPDFIQWIQSLPHLTVLAPEIINGPLKFVYFGLQRSDFLPQLNAQAKDIVYDIEFEQFLSSSLRCSFSISTARVR